MEDKILLERIRRYNKLNEKDKLLYEKRKKFRNDRLIEILYFSAVLYFLKISFESFAASVNIGLKIRPLSVFGTGLVVSVIEFFKSYLIYVIFIFFGLAILFIYYNCFDKNYQKEKKIRSYIIHGK